ncbi:MAG: UDP-N-acetylmuramate dehydrogenase [Anaerolineaceae bacterium]|nr:UDP-N-acetylmuramate dehydrogenase [Anaerolineaceae bacterium]
MKQKQDTRFPQIKAIFGNRLQEDVLLSSFTSNRVGGKVEGLIICRSAVELQNTIEQLWSLGSPFRLLGGGSNILICEEGISGIVVHNQAKQIKIIENQEQDIIWAEAGAALNSVANYAAVNGFAGLEWAAGIPGTLGGAVYGNAGAFGSDISSNFNMAEILHPINGKQSWDSKKLDFKYRSTKLKRESQNVIILEVTLKVFRNDAEVVLARMQAIREKRKIKQPPGPSSGSMFKNPPGDSAGRLIEAVGLKGFQIGNAQISTKHANFFINNGGASADDFHKLIRTAKEKVFDEFGIKLELEVELWDNLPISHNADGQV